MDLVGRTGNMQETAVLLALRADEAGAELQSILDLLAGNRHQAGHIAEGADLFAGLEGPLAGVHIGADAAAVHHSDVAVQLLDLVEVSIDAVSHEVAEVGLAHTDAALAGSGVVDVEFDVRGGDLLAQHSVHIVDPGFCGSGHSGVGDISGGDELGGDRAVLGDGHFTDVCQIRAGLGQGDSLAGCIVDLLVLHDGVRVAVDEGVKAGGVGNDFLTGPGRGGRVNAQMAQTDDDVCAQSLGLVDGLLDGVVQLPAVVTAQDVVDVLGLLGVHEVSRSGLGEGLRGRDAHECDPLAACGEQLDSGQDAQAGAQVHPVAGDIGEVRFLDDGLCTGHAVVELVVARSSDVVASLVHQLDDGSAVVHGAVGSTLNMVACVHQQDGLALIHIALLHGSDSGIGQFGRLVVDVGVDIVGVQDGDSGILARQETGRSLRNGSSHGGGSGGDTGSLQEIAARNKVFHEKGPPLCSRPVFAAQPLFRCAAFFVLSLPQNRRKSKRKDGHSA